MISFKGVIKTITASIGAIVIALFFLFLLTYDFSKESEKQNTYSLDDLSNQLYKKIDDSIDDYSNLNILKIGIDDEYINNVVSYIIRKNDENLLESKYWTVSNIKINILEDKIELDIFVKYHNELTYKLKIKAIFTIKKSANSYTFYLKNMKIGSLYITKDQVQKLLAFNSDSTVGYIYNKAIELLPFGTYNINTLSYTIYKKEIIDDIDSGLIGELINKKSANLNKFLTPIIDVLFENNLLNLEFKKERFDVVIEYSKLISNKETVDKLNNKNVLNELYNTTCNYDIILASLLGVNNLSLNGNILNDIVFENISSSFIFFESKYIKYYNSGVNIVNDELHIYYSIKCFDEYSLFDYVFIIKNKEYILDRIEIGRDSNEKSDSYIVSSYSENKARFLRVLYRSNLKGNIYLETIKLESLLNKLEIGYGNVTIENGIFMIEVQKGEIDISDKLLSDEFNELIENINIDSSTKESLIQSFANLSVDERIFYFNKIKDYYKDDISVYNYICNLIDQEENI